jgi:hypothetical protein
MTASPARTTAMPQPKTQDQARLRVTSGRSRRRGFGVAAVLAAFALLGAFFGLAAFHTVLVQGQYEVTQIDIQTAERANELLELRLDVARLKNPDRLRNEATYRLGLVPAAQTTYLAPSNAAVAEVAAATLPLPVPEDERSDS